MTHHKSYKDESQDARRHDKHDATHPNETRGKSHDKLAQKESKHPHSQPSKRK